MASGEIAARHATDVGVSVNSTVDVAKEVVDAVLTRQDLEVLAFTVQANTEQFRLTLAPRLRMGITPMAPLTSLDELFEFPHWSPLYCLSSIASSVCTR
jgi:hypothetical protein